MSELRQDPVTLDWVIEILPRLLTPAGFELGSRIPITLRTPEDTAAALRRRLRDPAPQP